MARKKKAHAPGGHGPRFQDYPGLELIFLVTKHAADFRSLGQGNTFVATAATGLLIFALQVPRLGHA